MNPKNPNWILVVENDPHYSETLAELMQLHGYRVLLTRNPIDAKEMSESNSIDLAIVGVRLINDNDENDFSGLRLASEIDPRIPKIILSGYMAPELVRRALIPGKRQATTFYGFRFKDRAIREIK
jgi:DNA-binding NtrC family response regulator